MMVLRDVLVPVDFEPTSYRALAFGRNLAQAFGAKLHVLHVQENTFALSAGTEGSVSAFPLVGRQIHDDEQRRLEGLLTAEDRTAGANATVLFGDSPAAAIASYAKETQASLIVMGTHGRSGKPLGAIGSVAEQVVRTAECPVLTMRQAVPQTVASETSTVAATAVHESAWHRADR